MSKARKTVSAKEVSADIRAGMTDEQLMQKYGLSEKGVRNLFGKLVAAGVMSESQVAERTVLQARIDGNQHSITVSSEPAKPASSSVTGERGSKPAHSTAFEVEAVAGAKGLWKLSIVPDLLRIESPDGTTIIEVPRPERMEKLEVRSPRLMSPLLIVHGKKKKAFKLDRDQLEAIVLWTGPVSTETLRVALKRRFRYCLAIGVIFVVLALPLPGDPASDIDPLPFDVFGAGLGVSLIVLAVLSRYWISGIIFLLDGFWFLLAAGSVAYGVYTGDSAWWLIGTVLLACFAVAEFREYLRFKDVKGPIPPDVG